MKTRALVSIAVVACGVSALPARADKPALKALFEIKLDIDSDGKMDRAVLVGPPESENMYGDYFMLRFDEHVDLYIYLAVGDEKLDLSRKPAFRKKDIVELYDLTCVYPLKSKGNGSLIVYTDTCGRSNGNGETLTIVHRGGEILVAGFGYVYEGRDADVFYCDINFLSGKGVAARGLSKSKPIRRKFTPLKLADWSEDRHPKECSSL